MGNAITACQTCSIVQCDACAEVLPRLINNHEERIARSGDEAIHPSGLRNSPWAEPNAGQDYQPTNMSEAELMRLAQQRSLIDAGITPSPEDVARLQGLADNDFSSPSLRDATPIGSPMFGGASSPFQGASPTNTQSEEEMLATAIRASQQEERSKLREDQAREYEESLAIDRQRQEEKQRREAEEERKRREAEDAEERRLREEEEAKMKAKEEVDNLRARTMALIDKARSRLSEEPPADEAGRVNVRVRTPDGKALKRAFRSTDPVGQVYDFIISEGGEDLACQDFRVIATMPRAVYEDRNSTLSDAGLQGQCALLVEIIEPDDEPGGE